MQQRVLSVVPVAVDEVAPGRVDAAEVESLEKAAVDAMVRAPPAIPATSTSFSLALLTRCTAHDVFSADDDELLEHDGVMTYSARLPDDFIRTR